MNLEFWKRLVSVLFKIDKEKPPEKPAVISTIRIQALPRILCDPDMLVPGTHVGLMQSGGIGDLIIALPIAAYLQKKGAVVHWPVDSVFAPFMRDAAPDIHFIDHEQHGPGLDVSTSFKLLKELNCDPIIPLYSHFTSGQICDTRLANSLKFDEYKYAIAGVPFTEKWNFNIRRNYPREMALFNSLNIDREYICVHRHGSIFSAEVDLPDIWIRQFQIIEIDEISNNPFDWIHTLEHASKLVLLDSCMANLVDQLDIGNEKYLILRSHTSFTPVLKNGWKYI